MASLSLFGASGYSIIYKNSAQTFLNTQFNLSLNESLFTGGVGIGGELLKKLFYWDNNIAIYGLTALAINRIISSVWISYLLGNSEELKTNEEKYKNICCPFIETNRKNEEYERGKSMYKRFFQLIAVSKCYSFVKSLASKYIVKN